MTLVNSRDLSAPIARSIDTGALQPDLYQEMTSVISVKSDMRMD